MKTVKIVVLALFFILVFSGSILAPVSGLPSTGSWTKSNVSNTSGDSWFADAELEEEDGTLHFVWLDLVGSYYQVFYNYRTSSGVLGSPKQLTSTSNDKGAPRIAVSPSGDAMIVWAERRDSALGQSIYMRKTTNGVWDSSTNLISNPGNVAKWKCSFPDVAFNRLGQYSIVYTLEIYEDTNFPPIYSDVYMATQTVPARIVDTGQSVRTASAFMPRIVYDKGNLLHMVYNYQWAPGGIWGEGLMVCYKNWNFVTSVWGSEILVAGNVYGNNPSAHYPDIAVTSAGTPVFTYRETSIGTEKYGMGDLYLRIGAQGTIVRVDPYNLNFLYYGHSVNVRPNGNVLVAWSAGTTYGQTMYCAEFTSSGVLSDSKRVFSEYNLQNPVMLVNGAGKAVIMYEDYHLGNSKGEIYLAEEEAVAPPAQPPAVNALWSTGSTSGVRGEPQTFRATVEGGGLGSTFYYQWGVDSTTFDEGDSRIARDQTGCNFVFTFGSEHALGAHTVQARTYTLSGSARTYSVWKSISFTLVAAPPVATPTFNPPGGTYSSAQTVTISCATSGATIRYTTNGVDPTSASNQYTVPITVGSSMTVKARGFKSGMSDSDVATATYSFGTDSTPPTGSITIDSGAATTHYLSVALTISATDPESGVTQMRFSNDGSTFSTWEPYATSKSWTMSSGDGPKSVYVEFMNGALLQSSLYVDTIVLDTTPPTGTISINNGEATANSTSVTLYITWADNNAMYYQMQLRFSNDGVWDTEPWEPVDFSPTKAWTLSQGDGAKTIYYQIKDGAGLLSPVYSETILLMTVIPEFPQTLLLMFVMLAPVFALIVKGKLRERPKTPY